MVYNETVQTYYNINLNGFIMNEEMFKNVTMNPSNAGFCTPAGNCLVSGIFNLSNCIQSKFKSHMYMYIINKNIYFF